MSRLHRSVRGIFSLPPTYPVRCAAATLSSAVQQPSPRRGGFDCHAQKGSRSFQRVDVKESPKNFAQPQGCVPHPTEGVLSQRFVSFLTRRHGFDSGVAANPIIPSQAEDDGMRTRKKGASAIAPPGDRGRQTSRVSVRLPQPIGAGGLQPTNPPTAWIRAAPKDRGESCHGEKP